jgi:1-phosphofructokinase family hexose kinase
MNTILSDPGPETDAIYVEELKKRLRKRLHPGDWLVIAGSIPPPLDATVYTDLIEEAAKIGAHTVLDADGAALAAGAAAHPDMLKGNKRELERLLGRHLEDEQATLQGAQQVHDGGVSHVVITRGREGALAVADTEYLRGLAPRVRAVSAVGSGDAFLAGVVLTLSKEGSMADALRLGIAAGTASVLLPGTELCRRREVDILMPRVRVHPIPAAC